MNRLGQLKETLIRNIDDTKDYPNVEFVILDYNSQDGMEDWFKTQMMTLIDSEKVLYYKTSEPQRFAHSHAKNLAFKLSTGDILCNINADHFIGKNFAQYLNKIFTKRPEIVVTPIPIGSRYQVQNAKDVYGKVCIRRSDFFSVCGFDERMKTYGFEDIDLILRLELIGIKRVILRNEKHLQYVSHADSERFSAQDWEYGVRAILIHHISHYKSCVIYLNKNHTYETGDIIDNDLYKCDYPGRAFYKGKSFFDYSVDRIFWNTGYWRKTPGSEEINLDSEKGMITLLSKGPETFLLAQRGLERTFYKVTDEILKVSLLKFRYLMKNRALMEDNLRRKVTAPNTTGFGQGLVYKNFNSTEPFLIR